MQRAFRDFDEDHPLLDECPDFCQAWSSIIRKSIRNRLIPENEILLKIYPIILRLLEYPFGAPRFLEIVTSQLSIVRNTISDVLIGLASHVIPLVHKG